MKNALFVAVLCVLSCLVGAGVLPVIDDFESYSPGNPITVNWSVNSNATIVLVDKPVFTGTGAMELSYLNPTPSSISSASTTFATAMNFKDSGFDALVIFFRGASGNDPEPFYCIVEDSAGHISTQKHDDGDVLINDNWQHWTVPLEDISEEGVELLQVKKITLQIGDSVGGSDQTGAVLVDAIQLDSLSCDPADKPAGDLTDDCKVDIEDVAVFASNWLLGTISGYEYGTVYYVDSVGGDDSNPGTSADQAWQSLTKVNATVYAPGDEILFKAGSSYTGKFSPQGSGAAGFAIVVDQYGEGNKPLIDGTGYLAAVQLEGVEYWELNNLEVINDGGAEIETGAADERFGVYLKANNTGVRHHIYLRNLYIHDVYASVDAKGKAIGIESGGLTLKTNFDDILIEDCHLSLTGHVGIWLHHKVWWHPSEFFAYNNDIRIVNNLLEDIGGPGIQPNHCQNVLIENNTIDGTGASVDSRQKGRGSGIWPWHCENMLVQFNKLMGARGPGDSCGIHVDIENINTTIQYNLSYDNEGGFVEILGKSRNTIYRYNVSINDGWRVNGVDGALQDGHIIWFGGWAGEDIGKDGPYNSHIYNNTIYLAAGLEARINIEDTAADGFIENNIFYIDGTIVDANPSSTATNIVFDNNLYNATLPAILMTDSNVIIADPLFVNKGGITADDYMLQTGSEAIDNGLTIPFYLGRDYWGNSLIYKTDIGAHEKE